MARSDESKQDPSTSARVYKAADVHVRRAEGKSRPGLAKLPKVNRKVEGKEKREERFAVQETPLDEKLPEVVPDSKPEPESRVKQKPKPRKERSSGETGKVPLQESSMPPVEEKAPSVSPTEDQVAPEDSEQTVRRKVALRPTRQISRTKVAIIVVAVVLVAGLALAGFFAWNRWWRYDDHADMQGSWFVAGTAVPVTIDANAIYLTDDVTYQYEINDHDKTISYTYGPMKGQGRYWFNDDRTSLAITDGDGYTAMDTAFEDFVHSFEDFAVTSGGGVVMLPEGDGIIVLSREADPKALAEKQKKEREAAELEAKKAREKEEEEKAAEEENGYGYGYVDYSYVDYTDNANDSGSTDNSGQEY